LTARVAGALRFLVPLVSAQVKPLDALLLLLVVISPAQAQTAADTGRLYPPEQLDVVPVLLRQPAIAYPDSLKRRGIGGAVRVSVVVDGRGHVDPTSVHVVSSPDTGLNASARATVLGTKFTGGQVRDHRVRTLLTLSVLFDPLDTARVPSPIYGHGDSLSETPSLLGPPAPQYPPDLSSLCVQGRVLVQMIIDTLGRPEHESIQFVSLPHPGFIMPVSQYLAIARFRPARRGGRPVRSIVYFRLDFTNNSCPAPSR
jgi:TonB family protein